MKGEKGEWGFWPRRNRSIINLVIIISKEYQNRNYLTSKNIFFVHLNEKGERREPTRVGANFSKEINILHWKQKFSYFCLDYHYVWLTELFLTFFSILVWKLTKIEKMPQICRPFTYSVQIYSCLIYYNSLNRKGVDLQAIRVVWIQTNEIYVIFLT